jgi:uncharacterized membrane protein required for colicin V production
MNWIDIVVVILLVLGFIGGTTEGAVRAFASLIAVIISIPLAGLCYRLIASLLSFLPGENWENFIGFFIALGIITAILHLIFLLPKKLIGAVWNKGILLRLLGGVFNVLGGMIGMVVFTLVVQTYPIFDWLARWVSSSGALSTLVDAFGFVQGLLPEVFHRVTTIV